ncbi:MAG TPA: hypothetical protein PLU52_04245 [Opitutaceae bacterium]|nr:hypothetical protein [Opitutaceae bacterium]
MSMDHVTPEQRREGQEKGRRSRMLTTGPNAAIVMGVLINAHVFTQNGIELAEGWDWERIAKAVNAATGAAIDAKSLQMLRSRYFGEAVNRNGKGGSATVRALKQENLALRAQLVKAREKAAQVEAALKVVATLQQRIFEEGRRLDRIETEVNRAKAEIVVNDLRPVAVA